MSQLSAQAQAIVTSFGQQPGVTQDQLDNLQAIIEASPVLAEQVNRAVAEDRLREFVPLTNPNAGGEYDGPGRTLRLPLTVLTTPSNGHRFNTGEPTFVLGHELGHGFNYPATVGAYQDFRAGAALVAQRQGHDYTAAISALITANRRDEAGAEIAGWNALVSLVTTADARATLRDVYERSPGRAADFIDQSLTGPPYTYTIKSNLTLNADLSLAANAANLEAMGQNYFDKPPKEPGGLGPRGNSDYANYYGAYGISTAAFMERRYNPAQPHITVNLSQLRLTEKLLEENGIDLGGQMPSIPYADSSNQPPVSGLFQHTRATHQHSLPISSRNDGAASPPFEGHERTLDPSQPGHRDHVLYQQVRGGVTSLDALHGRRFDETSERLTASLLALAKQHGIARVDHVLLSIATPELPPGHNIFVVQGRMDDPANLRAHLPTAAAAQTPVGESFQRVQDINQSLAAELAREPAIETVQDPTPRQQAPVLAR